MQNKELLSCFSISEERATLGGKYPGQLTLVERKFKYDADAKRYTEKIDYIALRVMFVGLRCEKILIKVPASSIADDVVDEWINQLEQNEPLFVKFSNLEIGLSENKDGIVVRAMADGVEEVFNL